MTAEETKNIIVRYWDNGSKKQLEIDKTLEDFIERYYILGYTPTAMSTNGSKYRIGHIKYAIVFIKHFKSKLI